MIPVVFHVIHKFGSENISKNQIVDGLRVLNETFRKTRSDTASIVTDFQPIHADCGIEFRLATRDPDGNCHPGINRIASVLTNTGGHAVKQLVQWDPSRYLNVYVVNNAAGLAGHAVWPADADTIPEWDGIVISHDYVGSIGTSSPTRSVVLAHECGHYLNLHHIWGGNNVPGFYYLPVGQATNCDFDDLVDDTPNTIGNSSCNLAATSCGSIDNVQNAMDYSYCNIMFTQGQRDRMRACLQSPIAGRNNLWQPENLASTGVDVPAPLCAADFEADKRLACNESVTYADLSYHGHVTSRTWQLHNSTWTPGQDSLQVVPYNPFDNGPKDITLTVADSMGNSYSSFKPGIVTVLPFTARDIPFFDSFETYSTLDNVVWARYSHDDINRFELTFDGSANQTASVSLDNQNSILLSIDELFGPKFNLTGATALNLSFRYAFSGQVAAQSADKLQVFMGLGCNGPWAQRWNRSGAQLQTAPEQPGPFTPSADQWETISVTIPQQYFTQNFRFKFVFTSAGNNRLFIDDVQIDVNAGVDPSTSQFSGLSVFPQAGNDAMVVRFGLSTAQKMELSLLDATGRVVLYRHLGMLNAGNHEATISTASLATGVYSLVVASWQNKSVVKVVIAQ